MQLKSAGDETAITLTSRDAQAAKAAGVLPASGKGRLIIGNHSDSAVPIAVNKKAYNVAAGAGADDPKTGLNWDIAPGTYTIEISYPGKAAQTEKLTIAADEAWGLVILPTGGSLAVQLY